MAEKSRFGHLELERQAPPGPDSVREIDSPGLLVRAGERELNGDFDEALRLYARALGVTPHLEAAWLGQCRCLSAAGDFDEAALWAGKGRQYLPRSANLSAAAALARAREGRVEEARRLADEAATAEGGGPLVWVARAWSHGRERAEAAESCLARALELGREDPFTLLEVAEYQMASRRWTVAVGHLQRLRELRPALARPHFLLGRCYERLRMVEPALDSYREATRLNPGRKLYARSAEDLQRGGLLGLWRRLFPAAN